MSSHAGLPAIASLAVALLGLGASSASADECAGTTELGIKQVGSALVFDSPHLNIDADGAPNAYRLDGNGLSYTCDGVLAKENGKRVSPSTDPQHWQAKCNAAWKRARETGDYGGVAIFGFESDSRNRPLVQKAGDPLPGEAYITTTSVTIPGAPNETQRRYVDAVQIPYIVLPPKVVARYALVPGSIAVVYRPSSGKAAFAVYGDGGGLGEGSVRLHQDLGSEPMLVRNGIQRAKRRIEDRVVTVVFRTGKAEPVADPVAWRAKIQQQGQALLDAFGGMEKVEACSKSR